ncbi:MAG: HAD-IA family hydrolase [Actinobacteria bacterium]|nr:HAD family hydrolase [Actinomycetota bacterium]NIU70939.1 HAD family hydrolase [Actinomycetota bacterium]NIW32881.1 HAD-IA family hydrolase [Actinomycetota bacterium]NIX25044.1 HAD-IA family hydrolase [Actinomycetota bacterium]
MFTVILEECGYEVSHADGLMERFLELRHDVELFPDVLPALERLAARYPMASLSNGNADIRRLGLDRYMPVAVSAGHAGTAKPDPAIFLHACDALGFAPREVVHVGDHPVEDVRGARDAGMVTVWINRGGAAWEHDHRADFEVSDLAGLVALLEAL